eukprot:CAMPEP_0119397914 /NCGR_PEP_ID=MMETSP1334-20130426/140330_1 /TAXON_ID=127549 /ORGANISM="Calcidiscus leptoporus, Strain RCC1130" /LENGTH=338 /DNA_ID=CAMNT_0007421765 /DNA_START=45 /DNA_END=1061 /DNA_ORIENTATION=+
MSALKILLCSLALLNVNAHVSMDRNGVAASGGFFTTHMKIPHGKFNGSDHMFTTKIELQVPPGVRSVKGEPIHGWSLTTEMRDLSSHEQYSSHGKTVTKGPSKITWQALSIENGVHNEHLMLVGLQIRFGCNFDNPTYASTTGTRDVPQPYTTWWPVTQTSSNADSKDMAADHVDKWTNAPNWADNDETGERPCPYIYIYPGNRCDYEADSGAPAPPSGGMMWFGEYKPYDPNGGWQEYDVVMQLIEDEMEDLANLRDQVDDAHGDANRALSIGIAALVLGATALGFLAGLCIFRITAGHAFAEVVAAVPLTSTIYASRGAGAGHKACESATTTIESA